MNYIHLFCIIVPMAVNNLFVPSILLLEKPIIPANWGCCSCKCSLGSSTRLVRGSVSTKCHYDDHISFRAVSIHSPLLLPLLAPKGSHLNHDFIFDYHLKKLDLTTAKEDTTTDEWFISPSPASLVPWKRVPRLAAEPKNTVFIDDATSNKRRRLVITRLPYATRYEDPHHTLGLLSWWYNCN